MTKSRRPDKVTMAAVGICGETGKRKYTNRRAAKQARKMTGRGMSVFPCEPGCGMWHIGHKQGVDRAAHRHRREQAAAR